MWVRNSCWFVGEEFCCEVQTSANLLLGTGPRWAVGEKSDVNILIFVLRVAPIDFRDIDKSLIPGSGLCRQAGDKIWYRVGFG